MQYRKIERTDLQLSIFGLGCWAFGGGDYWGQNHDQKEVDRVVHRAADLGVNYFDTAEVYNDGRSEKSLGLAIKGLDRDKLVIGTKISPSHCYPDKISRHCEASLNRLDTDYVDIYMVHWPIHPHSIRHYTKDENIINNPPALDEVMEKLLKLKKEGKIRHIGVSNHGVQKFGLLPHNETIVANELPYNLLCRAPEFQILPFCQEKGVGVIGYMSLLQGILTDRYPTIDDIPLLMRRTRHFDDRKNEHSRHGEAGFEAETQAALQSIRQVSRDSGISTADLALKWAVVNEAITSSLVGVRGVERLEANIKAINEPLDPQIIDQLDQASDALKEAMGTSIDYYEGVENDRT